MKTVNLYSRKLITGVDLNPAERAAFPEAPKPIFKEFTLRKINVHSSTLIDKNWALSIEPQCTRFEII